MTHIYFGKKVRFLINAGRSGFLLSSSDNMNDALAADIAARREADPDTQIGMQYTWNRDVLIMDWLGESEWR